MPIRTAKVKDASRAAYHVQKATAALALGDWKEAIERYRSALDFDPDDDDVRMSLAEEEARHGDGKAAAKELVQVLDIRPPHPEAWNLLGVLLMKNGERADAERCWKRALDVAPEFELSLRNLRDARSFPKPKGRPSLLDRAVLKRLFHPVGRTSGEGTAPHARLSVCLIVKDEEELLGECLDSVAGIADEIIVVDTGSTDGTIEIAKSRGAKVHSHEWKDDFAEARNALLRKARMDWVLMIDADERLAPDSAAGLRRFIESGTFDHATVEIESTTMGETLAFRAVRLFRNYPRMRYAGRIHEQIAGSLVGLRARYGIRGGDASVRILHLGYEHDLFEQRGKHDRNERLLAAELEANPKNAYALLKQGESLFSQRRFEEAAGPFEKAWTLTKRAALEQKMLSLLEEPATLRAACAVAAGRYQDAIDALDDYHGLGEPTANTLYLEAVARWSTGRDGVAERLIEALEHCDRGGATFTLPEVRGATPRYILGSLALAQGNAVDAGLWFERALQCETFHREARLGLAQAHYYQDRPDKAIAVLAALLQHDPSDLAAWKAGALYLTLSRGHEEAARAWLEAALLAFPGEETLLRFRERSAEVSPAASGPGSVGGR